MMSGEAVAEVLGIEVPDRSPTSHLFLLDEVKKGLPLSALDCVVRSVAPRDSAFAFRLVPRATLAKRKAAYGKAVAKAPRLSPSESAKVARLAEVWAFARRVWRDDDKARNFLFRPHPMLDGRRPVDVVLESEHGRPLVEGILGRLEYGSAA